MASRAPIDWQEPVTLLPGSVPAQQPVPQTGFTENFNAGVGEMVIAGNTGSQTNNLRDAYRPLLDALGDAPFDEQTYYGPAGPIHYRRHMLNPADLADDTTLTQYGSLPTREQMRQAIFGEIRRRRQTNPQYLPGVPDNPDEFERQANERTRAQLQSIRDVQSRATGWGRVGGFIGGVAGSFEDPVNLATLPIGGAETTFVRQVGRAAIENMIVEAVSQPQVVQNYAALGEDQTLGDSIRSVLMAGVAGGTFHAAVRGASEIAGRTIGPVYDRMVQHVFDNLPEPMQRRWADRMTLGDHPLVDLLRVAVPEENWTPDLHAAVNVVQREHEIGAASPFEPGPAGDAEHGQSLADALRRIADDNPPIPEAAPIARPAAAATPPAPDYSDARNPAFEQMKARIRHVESGGNDSVRNAAGSSAQGRFQFTDETWLGYYHRRYGAGGSRAEILARKTDPNIQEVLMDDALADYARMLRRVGAPVDAGNLYMTHGLGIPGAEAFLRANPNERAIDVYRRVDPHHADQAMRQNPFLRGTVGDTIAWFHQRMGGHAPPPVRIAEETHPAEPAPVADTASAEPAPSGLIFDDRPVLRVDQFDGPEEHARAQVDFEAGRDARDGFAHPETGDGFGTMGREAYARAHGDLWLRPLDHLDDLFDRAKLSEAAQLSRAVELIGFEPSARLSRTLENEHFNFDRVAALIEREAEAAGREIPPAAERIIAPKWDDPPLTDLPMSEDVEKLQRAHGAAADNDVHMISSEVGWALRDIDADRIRAVLEGRGDLDAQAAMATVRLGYERMGELGVARDKVPGAIAEAMVRNGVSPATADQLTRSILEQLSEGGRRKPAPEAQASRLALPSPMPRDPRSGRNLATRSEISASALAASLRPSTEALAQFDEPMGKAALAQTGSLEHDLTAAIESDPNLREQPFVIDAGDARPLDSILRELDAEKAAAEALRGCL